MFFYSRRNTYAITHWQAMSSQSERKWKKVVGGMYKERLKDHGNQDMDEK